MSRKIVRPNQNQQLQLKIINRRNVNQKKHISRAPGQSTGGVQPHPHLM
jgi:hypothetical protein